MDLTSECYSVLPELNWKADGHACLAKWGRMQLIVRRSGDVYQATLVRGSHDYIAFGSGESASDALGDVQQSLLEICGKLL